MPHHIPCSKQKEELKHVEEVLQLFKIFSNDKRFEDVYNEYVKEPDQWKNQGGNNMCYILDQVENRVILYVLFLLSILRNKSVINFSHDGSFYYSIAISTLFFYVVLALLNCIIYSAVYLAFIFLIIGLCLGKVDEKVKRENYFIK